MKKSTGISFSLSSWTEHKTPTDLGTYTHYYASATSVDGDVILLDAMSMSPSVRTSVPSRPVQPSLGNTYLMNC